MKKCILLGFQFCCFLVLGVFFVLFQDKKQNKDKQTNETPSKTTRDHVLHILFSKKRLVFFMHFFFFVKINSGYKTVPEIRQHLLILRTKTRHLERKGFSLLQQLCNHSLLAPDQTLFLHLKVKQTSPQLVFLFVFKSCINLHYILVHHTVSAIHNVMNRFVSVSQGFQKNSVFSFSSYHSHVMF